MTVPKRKCKLIIEIDLMRAQGIEVPDCDSELYRNHIAVCPDCAKEAAALNIIAAKDNAGAIRKLDDLSRRRLVEEVIAKAETAEQNKEPVLISGKPGWSKVAWAASLIAASIAAVFIWKPWVKAPQLKEEHAETKVAALNEPLEGNLLLLSGNVELKGKKAFLSDRVKSNDRIATTDGRAVVSLPTGIVLSMAQDTSLSFYFAGDSIFKAILDRGQIQASVDPLQKRAGFTVVTKDGTIDVVGTVFSVNAKEDVEVRVLRGEVKIKDVKGQSHNIKTNAAATLSFARSWALSKQEKEYLWEEARAVNILDMDGETAVNISSKPMGASVIIDSVMLGKTPISASIKAGYRELSLLYGQNRFARELMNIEADAAVTREFNFEDLEEAPKDLTIDQTKPLKIAQHGKIATKIDKATPKELLKSVQKLRAQGDWKSVAGYYEKLIADFPNSGEAKAGLISLCEIKLEKLGQPKDAFDCYEKYLREANQGPLIQEAMYGKAKALKKLNNTDAEIKALESFLNMFPNAIQAKEAQERIRHLQDGQALR